jgi:hypothetical protein
VPVNSVSHENQEVHLPLPLKDVECLVGVLDQVAIRLAGTTDFVTDCRHDSPVNEFVVNDSQSLSNVQVTSWRYP